MKWCARFTEKFRPNVMLSPLSLYDSPFDIPTVCFTSHPKALGVTMTNDNGFAIKNMSLDEAKRYHKLEQL